MKLANHTELTRRSFLKSLVAFGAGATASATALSVRPELLVAEENEGPAPGSGVFIESETYKDGEVIDVDLLIVGTGFAGMWAALTASDAGVKKIAFVDKGAIGKSGVSNMVMGGSIYLMPGEDMDGWLTELVKTPAFLSRQDIWQDLLEKSHGRLEKYNSWGLEWTGPRIHSDGNVNVAISMIPKYNGIPYGRGIITALTDQLLQRQGIHCYSKTMITKLLKDGDRVSGAIGVNRVTGNAVAFQSKATILATGKCSFRGPHVTTEVETGDGYGLAYDAGATLNNMEFWAFDIDPANYGLEGGTLLATYGARLLNGENHEFMWEYDPKNGAGADARISSHAMALEVQAGRGPIKMDRTTYQYILSGQYGWDKFLADGSWQRINETRILEDGHDITKETEVFYANSFGIIGAVKANLDCSTELPGLFVSSTAISSDPGKTKGCESARASWSGETAGAAAAQFISRQTAPSLSQDYLTAELAAAKAPLKNEGTQTPSEITRAMHEILFDYRVSILKTEVSLKKALEKIQALKVLAVDQMFAADSHELIKYHETQNMLQCAELHLIGSIERKETRVCHFREDFPETDNKNWLKWINFNKGKDGKPAMSFEALPLSDYPIQPKEA
jgi:succinate dehydrogenase/fumarate reductase flavoprotein subunit